MLKGLRIGAIRQLIEWNEKLVFNRRLLDFYRNRAVGPIDRVIDVGANLGQSIDLFLKLNPNCSISAFEPNPKLFTDLKRRYANKGNVELVQKGVSDQVGELIFNENVFHSTSSFEEVDLDSAYLKRKAKVLGVKPEEIVSKRYPVDVITLQSFLASDLTTPIDVVKIDTEGHEYACLKGLFSGELPPIKYLQLEMHNDDMYLSKHSFDEIADLVQYNGFEVAEKIPHGFGDFDEVVFVNKKNTA